MIEIGKWRKDKKVDFMGRWMLPLFKITAGAKCLDLEYAGYGRHVSFAIIDRSYKWLERHTNPTDRQSVYKESPIKSALIIAYIFEEM